jgi:hypothetical protein
MFCLLSISLIAVGICVLAINPFRLGGYTIGRPHTIYMGLILVLQLPAGVLAGGALGAAEVLKAGESGHSPDIKRIQRKYAWVDLAVCGGATVLAGGIGLMAMRREVQLYLPPEQIAGVRDYAAEVEAKRAAEEEEAAAWRGVPGPRDR